MQNLTYRLGLLMTSIVFILLTKTNVSAQTTVTVLAPTNSNCARTFEYRVCQASGGHEISNWTIEMPSCIGADKIQGVYINNSPVNNWELGANPCGIFGLKIESPHISGGECKNIKIVFTMDFPVGSKHWTSKASTNCQVGGPVAAPANCSSCSVTGSIGDRVWSDTDGDGIQDSGEPGISGVMVHLRNSSGTVIATTTTNSSGNYIFGGLAAGNYTVQFPTTHNGSPLTIQNAGSNDNVDSDPNTGSGITQTISLAAGQNNTSVDAGYLAPCNGSIGDRVWSDLDGDGIQDSNEPGISGVTVQLKNAAGVIIATTNTNSSGIYQFSGLAAGNYSVLFPLTHASGSLTTQNVGSNDNIDSDPNTGTGITGIVSLTCGQQNSGVDAGYIVCSGSIGDRVWSDIDGDGIQDSNEPGIGGVVVQLRNSSGVTITSTTTNLNGNYLFSGLPAGTYSVGFPVSHNGGNLTIQNAGSNDNVDSDPSTVSGITSSITLGCGQNNTSMDAGYLVCTGIIGDRIWEDTDADGLQDSGETGISGVTVQLKNSAGTVVATSITNSNGNYQFVVPAGTYMVVFPLNVSNMMITARNVGSNDNTDSDADQMTGETTNVTVICGQTITNVDAGYFECTGVIGDRVWRDLDGDGIQDSNEPGISGVTVQLKNAGGVVVATTTTNLTGNYVFFGLAAGTYTVVFPVTFNSSPLTIQNAGTNEELDSDANQGTGSTGNINLSIGQVITYVDAGYAHPAVYNPDFNVTYINVPVPGNVWTNDVVPAGTTYGIPMLTGSPAGSTQTISMNSNGTYVFTANTPGVYTYNVPVCIPGQVAPCPNSLLTITVLAPNVFNNPPVANTDLAYTTINTPVVIYTLANDQAGNPGGSLNPASVTVTIAALHGTSSINPANGNNTYTPNPGFTGYDTLTYRVCDNSSPALCATAKQIIYVQANNVPNTTVAADDYAFTQAGVSVSGNVKLNDTDPEGHSQTVTAQMITVGAGTLVLNSNGNFTFTPAPGFTGPVSFTYQTCDNGTPSACASATLYILVSPPAPVYNPDINVTFVNVSVTGNVNTNDVVPAGTTYGVPTLSSSPAGSTQTITMNPNGTYTFIANTPGVYTYNVPVCVPGQVAPCPNTLLTITVLAPGIHNNPPVANTDVAYTTINTAVVINTLANDRAGNPGGTLNPASVTVTVAAAHGTSSINPANGNNTYTPNPGYTGYDTLTYQVCDNSTPALCATAKQIIYIRANNAANTTFAADDYVYTSLNTTVSGNAKTNDTDPEGNTQVVTPQTTTVPGKGTLVLLADGSFTFTPVTGFSGPVSFVYQTCDNGIPSVCATATIYVLVSPQNIADFTPSNDIDALSFTAQNMQRDFIVNISEVLNGYSTGQLVFRVRKLSAFTITYDPNDVSANVFGGTTVNNSDWIFTEDANFITLTLKPGVVIPAYGVSKVGFTITRNPGVPVNTTQNITVTIVTGTGGDTNSANNQAVTSITAN